MSSTQFVVVYASSCVLLHAANLVVWRFTERTAAAADDPPALDVYELAMLNGGPSLAITTAVTMVHRRGVLGVGPSPSRIAITGELDADADPLEREVYDAVRRTGAVAAAALARELADSDALESVRAGLRHGRLLMDARSIWWGRVLWLGGPFVLLVIGVARLLTTWDGDNDDATTYLLILTSWIALVTVEHVIDEPGHQRRFAGRAPPTALGRSLLTQWRKENPDDIASEQERVAMTIALTGDPKRRNADPLLASNAITSRARELDCVPAPAPARRPVVGELPGDALPIAEQLLLLGCAEPREYRPDDELGAQLAGAVLTELIVRERVAVQRAGDADETVAIIDASPT
ncbi:MAG TPA: TIGR04222 domain-containing membrane protein, partial [Solirubrobacteraceae bacterium]|nr:TIGR04222 domain-containing membrane protein [Solirubrobacteraceae bacterium]